MVTIGSDSYTDYEKDGESAPWYVAGFTAGFDFGFESVFFNHFSIPLESGSIGGWKFGSAMPTDAGLRARVGLRYRF